MKPFVFSYLALVTAPEFENQQAWEAICEVIRAPAPGPDAPFYANAEFVENEEFRDLSKEDLLPRVPPATGSLSSSWWTAKPSATQSSHPCRRFAPRARARFSRYPVHDSEHRE